MLQVEHIFIAHIPDQSQIEHPIELLNFDTISPRISSIHWIPFFEVVGAVSERSIIALGLLSFVVASQYTYISLEASGLNYALSVHVRLLIWRY